MTASDACQLLGLSWSQANFLLKERGIPSPRTTGGSRGRPGTLSVQAAEAVRQIAQERSLVIGIPITDASPIVVEPDRTPTEAAPDPQILEYLEKHEHVIQWQSQELQALREYIEGADALLLRMCQEIAELQASPKRVEWWRRFVPRVREVEARREFMPTEVYCGNVLRRQTG